ncbi:hypothetical protein ACOSQ2_023495 [Xanthoceras sorbifolium]
MKQEQGQFVNEFYSQMTYIWGQLPLSEPRSVMLMPSCLKITVTNFDEISFLWLYIMMFKLIILASPQSASNFRRYSFRNSVRRNNEEHNENPNFWTQHDFTI